MTTTTVPQNLFAFAAEGAPPKAKAKKKTKQPAKVIQLNLPRFKLDEEAFMRAIMVDGNDQTV